MTQPKFAPVTENAEVRDAYKLPPHGEWKSHRPADYKPHPRELRRANTGMPGPDQGYALKLAEAFGRRLDLAEGEHEDDVLAGAVMIALRRASLIGRAPVAPDIELALCLFGYLGGGPADLVRARGRLFSGISHDYWQQRDLADLVPEESLRLTPAEIHRRLSEAPAGWRSLTGLG